MKDKITALLKADYQIKGYYLAIGAIVAFDYLGLSQWLRESISTVSEMRFEANYETCSEPNDDKMCLSYNFVDLKTRKWNMAKCVGNCDTQLHALVPGRRYVVESYDLWLFDPRVVNVWVPGEAY